MKILAALSGGVDSAVAAYRLARDGHQVTAVHMALLRQPTLQRVGSRGCCSLQDATDARRAAAVLGLDFYVWDLSPEFEEQVVTDFLAEYKAGRTPNPCIRCNQAIKFATLLQRAQQLGFDAVATGHYARLGRDDQGRVMLQRARDLAKDQSYVLAGAGPQKLAAAIFPLGEVANKAAVRAEAARLGLSLASKPDSNDICFISQGSTADFLRGQLGARPGVILDENDVEVGHHQGAYAFTIGQRRGLSLPRPAQDGQPRYVTAVDVAANTVRVGPAAALQVHQLLIDQVITFLPLIEGGSYQVQLRAHGTAAPATAQPVKAGSWLLRLSEPLRAAASGQSAVLYSGDRVVAHGVITQNAS
ncbi:MAG: tRNA 2-thiouridine(34) synthase MnmA [Bifidobacteriaceae bacterium]|jgi:tRNA-specific 2-thiouridylase|nr:tRNA 2-thiouridine(34) synthase MnmA [Bifidobacteriaceae bacterium]